MTPSRLFQRQHGRVLAALTLSLGCVLAHAQTGAPAPATPLHGEALANTTVRPIRGFLPDLRFDLVGPGGQPYTQDNVAGRIALMFFGYASCPDVCPTTMAQLAHVMELLGPDADKVRILFVSVDPHRDTPEILAAYVQAFDDRHAIGLTGSTRQIADLARRYRVSYQIQRPDASSEHYDVAHGRGIYIFDTNGRARYLSSDSEDVAVLADTVRGLLPAS